MTVHVIVMASGKQFTVDAARYAVDDGYLELTGDDGNPSAVFAPGCWTAVLPRPDLPPGAAGWPDPQWFTGAPLSGAGFAGSPMSGAP